MQGGVFIYYLSGKSSNLSKGIIREFDGRKSDEIKEQW